MNSFTLGPLAEGVGYPAWTLKIVPAKLGDHGAGRPGLPEWALFLSSSQKDSWAQAEFSRSHYGLVRNSPTPSKDAHLLDAKLPVNQLADEHLAVFRQTGARGASAA